MCTMSHCGVSSIGLPGYMYGYQDGSMLSRERLVSSLCQVLAEVGIDVTCYKRQIGAVTTAARLGVPNTFIKKMGRWKSSVFMYYIETPWQQLAGVSSDDCRPQSHSWVCGFRCQ